MIFPVVLSLLLVFIRYGKAKMESKLKDLFGPNMEETGREGGEIDFSQFLDAFERSQLNTVSPLPSLLSFPVTERRLTTDSIVYRIACVVANHLIAFSTSSCVFAILSSQSGTPQPTSWLQLLSFSYQFTTILTDSPLLLYNYRV